MWGWVFVVTTTVVAFLKSEHEPIKRGPPEWGWRRVTAAYKQLYRITRLPSVRTLAIVLLTAKVNLFICSICTVNAKFTFFFS